MKKSSSRKDSPTVRRHVAAKFATRHLVEGLEQRICLSSAIAAFQAQQTFGAAAGPQAVAVGDFNRDGKLDTVTANFNGGNISVLLGNGNGTFQAAQNFAAGSHPYSVAVTDVNGDGKLDVLVANDASANVSVLLGNGNGTFLPQQTFAAGNGAHSIAVGDVNADGKLDVAIANKTAGTVSILLGNGNGTFQSQQTFSAGAGTASITIADLNSDGRLDLAVVNTSANNAGVLLGNGDGTFQAQTPYPLGAATPDSIAIGDFNNDGKLDLVTANKGQNAVAVLLNTGSGTFGPAVSYPVGAKVFAVVTADINGDGKADLISANYDSNSVSVLLGNGNGTFQPQVTFAVGTEPTAVAATDINGDGKIDLLAPNYGAGIISALLGDASPLVLSINRANPASPSANGTSATFTVTFSEPVTGVDPTDFSVATTGTVGDTLTQVTGASSVYTVAVSGITGNGTLGLNLVDNGSIRDGVGNPLRASSMVTFQNQQTFAADLHPDVVRAADVNGDGIPDLLAGVTFYVSEVSVSLGNGDGTFQPQQTFGVVDGPTDISTADLNGDGKVDLVVTNFGADSISVLLGNGNGTFKQQQTFATDRNPESVAVADVNRDGKPDILTGNLRNGTVSVLLGNGNGTFQNQVTIPVGLVGDRALTVSDVNGDGKADLLVIGNADNYVSVLLGNGNGTFQAQQTFAATSPVSIAVADFNADGRPDLVVTEQNLAIKGNTTHAVGVLLGNGDGTFQNQLTYAAGVTPGSVAVADFNGDGAADLLIADNTSLDVILMLGNGNGTFQNQQTFGVSPGPAGAVSMTVADLNRDGLPDFIVANNYPFTFSERLNANNGNFNGQTYTIDTVNPSVLSINRATGYGPFTTASSLDFTVTFSEPVTGVDLSDFALPISGTVTGALTQISGSGSVYTVTVNGVSGNGSLGLNLVDDNSIRDLAGNPLSGATQAFTPQRIVASAVAEPMSVVVADVNRDGKPDLISANFGGNNVSVSLGNGNGTFQSQRTYATGASPASLGVADVNADGIPDLVVANKTDGNVSVLLGNGNGTFQSQRTFAAGASSNSVAVADLNRDGKPDIAVANSGDNTISILTGTGDGTFQPDATLPTANYPTSVVVADVNGDGAPDLAVSSIFSNSLLLFLGNGDATFAAPQTITAGDENLIAVAADVNGDGKVDLVTSSFGAGASVNVLLGNGNGSFQAASSFAAGDRPFSVYVADVNSDGKQDVVVTNYGAPGNAGNTLSLLLGNGNGTFQPQQTLAVGMRPDTVVVADMNGDARPDIIVGNFASGTLGVLFSTNIGSFTSQTYNVVPALDTITGTAGVDQITLIPDADGFHLDWILNGLPGGQLATTDIRGLTINGNGGNDVITVDYLYTSPFPNTLHLNGVFTLKNLGNTQGFLGNGTIDLGRSTLYISYASPPTDPLALIQQYLTTGYHNGTWTGASGFGSISSSAAAADPQNSSVGYADSTDVGNPAGLPTYTIELRYTAIGDTNLDGTVGLSDLTTLLQNYNTGTKWDQGDLNYDGTVSLTDLTTLLQHYNQTASSPSALSAMARTLATAAPVQAASTVTAKSPAMTLSASSAAAAPNDPAEIAKVKRKNQHHHT